MDIDLLSKMVKELILDNDRVVLPGLGSFVAEIVPSTFSDKGYTINPPYRRLFFRSKPDEGNELARFYAESNNVELALAERIIADFISELKPVIHTKKTVVFPGLGRLRATKENNLFFVADADLDIYPEGFGLEPISLKTHQETREEVVAVVEDLKSILADPMPESDSMPESDLEPDPVLEPAVESVPEPAPAPEPDPAPAPDPAPESDQDPLPVQEQQPEMETVTDHQSDSESDLHQEIQEDPLQVPEETPLPVRENIEESAPVKRKNVVLKVAMIAAAVTVVLLVAYAVTGRLAPEFVDQFLYTAEELKILNHIL